MTFETTYESVQFCVTAPRIDRVGTNRNREREGPKLITSKNNHIETKSDKHRGLKSNAKANNSKANNSNN